MSVYVQLMCVGLAVALSGCDDTRDIALLQTYLQAVQARPGQAVAPVRSAEPMSIVEYGAAGLRSPFQGFHGDSAGTWKVSLAGSDEETLRARAFLESLGLEQFEMVGTLSNDHGANALMRAQGVVHRLKVGDYMGRNNGQIVSIEATRVEVFEVISDGRGGWLERTLAIPLKQQS